jgi:hypothetical protein
VRYPNGAGSGVANESFLQGDARGTRAVRNVGEKPNQSSEHDKSAPFANSGGDRGEPEAINAVFSDDVERVFARLRDRIGLDGS